MVSFGFKYGLPQEADLVLDVRCLPNPFYVPELKNLTGLDQEVNEAAMIDGASRWQRILHITIPLLMPTFFVLLIMSIGNFLNSGIDQYLAFCNALNKEHIEVLDLYVYNLGIGSGQISFSVAVGVMKSVIALILFTFANTASKKIRGTSVF